MNNDLIVSILRFAAIFVPQPRPPRTDYSTLTGIPAKIVPTTATPYAPSLGTAVATPDAKPTSPPPKKPVKTSVEPSRQQTSCIPCSRSHLSTVSGALGESLRFAREGGVQHPEVVRRLALAEDEVNLLERIDLSADAIARSPKEEQELAHTLLPKIRAVRQDIGAVATVEDLERVAADASKLNQDFRAEHLKMVVKGVRANHKTNRRP